MSEEEKYPSFGGRGSGTTTAYSVEARYNNPHPREAAGRLFDNRWQMLHFDKSPIGVPATTWRHPFVHEIGLLSYQAAQALRWWFLAQLETSVAGCLCFETRIVEHKVEYSYATEAIAHHDLTGGEDNDRIIGGKLIKMKAR